jgi:hypothetical protein
MQITEQQLDELADELQDRTCDFIGEELWQLLIDSELVEETDDNAIVLFNKVLKQYLHPNLTNAWNKSDLTFDN